MEIQAVITKNLITLHSSSGETRRVLASDVDYSLVKSLVLNEDWERLEKEAFFSKKADAIGMVVQSDDLGGEEIVTKNNGIQVHDAYKRIVKEPASHLTSFNVLCAKNPEPESVSQLLDFLRHKGIRIAYDGRFLALKSVRDDYTDWRTGTISHKVGEKPFMKRSDCCKDRKNGCAPSLHCGTIFYARSWGQNSRRIVLCAVSPEHVVSVPLDSSFQKLRCHHYEVLAEYPKADWDNNQALDEFLRIYSEKSVVKKQNKPMKNIKPTLKVVKPSKIGICRYALQLKKSKKGNAYVAKMVASKYGPEGVQIVLNAINDKRNGIRLEKDERASLFLFGPAFCMLADILKNSKK